MTIINMRLRGLIKHEYMMKSLVLDESVEKNVI